MTRILLPIIYFIAISISLSAQQQEQYSRAKIDLTLHSITDVAALGLEADHGIYAKGKHLINDFSRSELRQLTEAGIPYEVMITDVQQLYVEQNHEGHHHHHHATSRSSGNCDTDSDVKYNYKTPDNYVYGTMGGYLTYDQALTELDKMAALYPHLISTRDSIGDILTQEGRAIYWYRISDNPTVDEDKPEVLYTALHHAREPNSLSQLIFYMWYLLENYETDAEIRYLVDQTEMYFIPIVNPDGYVYNESTNPEGGGLWRKNRRGIGSDIFGVDLNRNYGYEWGHDDQGSSPNTGSATYRGEEGFSEPETQAVRDFCNAHQFRIAMNYHSFGNLLIYPWGYSDSETPDHPTFTAISSVMTAENDYFAGTGTETVGYTVNGDADDWMYGEVDSKPAIFSMTPEVGPGNFGFWPPEDAIDELNKSALRQNLVTAHLLLNYGEAAEVEASSVLLADQGELAIQLKKYGLQDGSLTLDVQSLSPALALSNTQLTTANFPHLADSILLVDYSVDGAIALGDELQFVITVDNGDYVHQDTITKVYQVGTYQVQLADGGGQLSQWSVSGEWGESQTTFVSGPSCYTDSPGQDYGENVNSSMVLSQQIDLEGAAAAFLRFYAKWDIEDNYDYVQVNVSTNGTDFVPLCGNYTNVGSNFQDEGQPLYDGVRADWALEEIDLSDYLGEQLSLSFTFVSDGGVEADGFYFDDLSIETISEGGTSTQQLLDMASTRVYPNPAFDQITVDLTLRQTYSRGVIKVTNSLGQVLTTHTLNHTYAGRHSQPIQLPASHLGVVFVHVELDGQPTAVHKVVRL